MILEWNIKLTFWEFFQKYKFDFDYLLKYKYNDEYINKIKVGVFMKYMITAEFILKLIYQITVTMKR